MKATLLIFEAIKGALLRLAIAERDQRIARRLVELTPDVEQARTAADFRVIMFDILQIMLDEIEPNKGPKA